MTRANALTIMLQHYVGRLVLIEHTSLHEVAGLYKKTALEAIVHLAAILHNELGHTMPLVSCGPCLQSI